MSTGENCYWIEEYGAYELCATGAPLPDLPEYWVRWDNGIVLAGGNREFTQSGYYQGREAPLSSQVAYGNGTIVNTATYDAGSNAVDDSGGAYSYTFAYSTDDGFTYSDPIDQKPWLPGVNDGGYDWQNGQWIDTFYEANTPIDFDGSRFVTVGAWGNDEGYNPTTKETIVTRVSTDGITWTRNEIFDNLYNCLHCAAYDGDIWYLSCMDWNGLYVSDYVFAMGYSDNDGATYTYNQIGLGIDTNSNSPRSEQYSDLSANSTGCHVVAEIFDDPLGYPNPYFYGIYYWRPTGNTTWASPILLWDKNDDFPTVPGMGASDLGGQILACRVNDHNLILSVIMGYDYSSIWLKRSIDGGVTWSVETLIEQLDYDTYSEGFSWQMSQGLIDIVELDDGRLVCTWVSEAYYPGYDTVAEGAFDDWPGWTYYKVSEDGGLSWSEKTLLSPFWVADQTYYGERFRACAKGVDVVITCTRSRVGSFNLIFRPTSDPEPEYLVPPSMVLPPIPESIEENFPNPTLP